MRCFSSLPFGGSAFERYGGEDATPVDPAEFAPPLGYFTIGYVHGEPVACGGWRVRGRRAR